MHEEKQNTFVIAYHVYVLIDTVKCYQSNASEENSLAPPLVCVPDLHVVVVEQAASLSQVQVGLGHVRLSQDFFFGNVLIHPLKKNDKISLVFHN